MIHHVTYEVDKKKITEELSFWACLGFNPACFGPRRRSRKQPIIHWLVCGDEAHAVELLPLAEPATWGLGHVAYVLGQREWEIATKELERFEFTYEQAQPHFGNHRRFVKSPTGYVVEILNGSPGLKAGPPLEG